MRIGTKDLVKSLDSRPKMVMNKIRNENSSQAKKRGIVHPDIPI
jgi:hypothetical protein